MLGYMKTDSVHKGLVCLRKTDPLESAVRNNSPPVAFATNTLKS